MLAVKVMYVTIHNVGMNFYTLLLWPKFKKKKVGVMFFINL